MQEIKIMLFFRVYSGNKVLGCITVPSRQVSINTSWDVEGSYTIIYDEMGL